MAAKKGYKLNIQIEDDFVVSAITDEAQRRGLSAEEMAAEIIHDWYDSLSLEEDLKDHEKSLKEHKASGGVEAEELFKRLDRES
jgi:hypothetical protein